MDSAKEKTLTFYEQVAVTSMKQAYLISQAPQACSVHNIPRFLIVTDGNVDFMLYKDGELRNMFCGAGTALYCATNGYLHSQLTASHICGSLSFYSSFIRSTIISFDGIASPPTDRDIFYHTNVPISDAGQKLLRALNVLSKNNFQHPAAISLLNALLYITIEDIKRSQKAKTKDSFIMWRKIDLYVQEHRTEPLTRNLVAAKFNISPGHLSFLFNKFGTRDFITSLIDCRLEYASDLLRKTNLPLKEITVRAGFNHVPYFIRQFKMRYKVTPRVFRNAQPLIENES